MELWTLVCLVGVMIAVAIGAMGVEHNLMDNPDPDAPPQVATGESRTHSSRWSYRSCADARADGRAPLLSYQDGYGVHLDKDRDGIACEPHMFNAFR